MKHIKLFEDYKSLDYIDDILLVYIDEDKCIIFNNILGIIYKFNNKTDFIDAINRLNKNNVTNFIIRMDKLYIMPYNKKEYYDKLFETLKTLFDGCKIQKQIPWEGNEIRYYTQIDNKNTLVASINDKKVHININILLSISKMLKINDVKLFDYLDIFIKDYFGLEYYSV